METKYAEVAPWQNMQKYQSLYRNNKQALEIKKQGN